MMDYPKFLVIRFPVGGAGNFVASCLQCSMGVGHWNSVLEHEKPNVDWLDYFKKVFQPEYETWFEREPSIKYTLGVKEIYSAYYPRGNDLSDAEFFEAEKKCSEHYHDLRSKDNYIPVFWMKAFFPRYYNNATFIDLMLDEPCLRWYDRSHYRKHYKLEWDKGRLKVYNNRHMPGTTPKSFTGTNQFVTYHDTFFGFARKEIYDNPHRRLFRKKDLFDDCSGKRPRHVMTLSDVLDSERFLNNYKQICDMIEVDPISDKELVSLHKHWIGCHDF